MPENSFQPPRLVIAGTSGDSGKTLVALGLLSAWRAQELHPVGFKKGPDYIDAAWLTWASGAPCRNLDTFLQPADRILESFRQHASPNINVIEGNRGLLDGMDAEGTHSTASLARLLNAPVILVVSAVKVTRTVAAVVAGCKLLEPDLALEGVILNRVSGPRHERVARQAVEDLTGIPVVGVLPRLKEDIMPGRHLGLVPPQEHEQAAEVAARFGEVAREHIELDRLLDMARNWVAGPESGGTDTSYPLAHGHVGEGWGEGPATRIGVFWDSAFTFYYPDNLEALEHAGAELVRISGLADADLPPNLDALYLGGGFPETHAVKLSENQSLMRQLRKATQAGMPIYAECGGLIYLARSLRVEDKTYAMAGVLPIDLELCSRPVGHGYSELVVDRENPFFAVGLKLKGHEFHYTRVVGTAPESLNTVFNVQRGTGCLEGRDGVVFQNVLAAYTHLHAVGVPEWAEGVVKRAVRWKEKNR